MVSQPNVASSGSVPVTANQPPVVAVSHLSVSYEGASRAMPSDVSFEVARGEVVLILGPSGSGKSTLALALNGLIPHDVAATVTGTVCVDGIDTRSASVPQLSAHVGMVFQDADAQMITGTVLDEVAFGPENLRVPADEVLARSETLLRQVGLWQRRTENPDRLSGGERQRLALAAVLAMQPSLLVLDEPTANLDPQGVVDLYAVLADVKAGGEQAIVLVEHNVDAAIELIDRVIVLDGTGRLVIGGTTQQVLVDRVDELVDLGVWLPRATLALRGEKPGRPRPTPVLQAPVLQAPVLQAPVLQAPVEPLIRVSGLTLARGKKQVVHGLSFEIDAGEFVAIVGPNGAGKSTLVQALAGLAKPREGSIVIGDKDVSRISARDLASRVGFVFQNPEHQFITDTVFDELAHGLRRKQMTDEQIVAEVDHLLRRFGLADKADVHPFLLSGGQKRRLSVATALVTGAPILILDEPTFGQDRAQADELVGLLLELNAAGTTVIIVTHDRRLVADHAQRAIELAAQPVAEPAAEHEDVRPADAPTRESARGFLHRLNPLATFAATAPAIVALAFVRDLQVPLAFIAISYVLLVTGSRLTKRDAIVLFAIVPAAVLVLGGSLSLYAGGPFVGFATALRIGALVSLALISGLTTTATAMVRSLMQQLKLPYRIGYTLLVSLRLVGRFRHDSELIRQAHRVRGPAPGRGPVIALSRWMTYAVALLASGIRDGERVALAMDARAFGAFPDRTERYSVPFRARDAAFIATFWVTTALILIALPR